MSHHDDAATDREVFARFHALLERLFPLVHEHTIRRVHGLSLTFQWIGEDPSLPPWLFLAHQDVAPVGDQAEQATWQHPPFAGAIAEGFVWGRGTLDDKASLIAWLSAWEHLLSQGFRSQRTLWLALGEDEEVGGRRGARQLAKWFAEQGIRFAMIVDEGNTITQRFVKVLPQPVAMVGIAEKGYLTVRLTAHRRGGHASLPTGGGAITQLAQALLVLERYRFPARIHPAAAAFLDHLGPHMPWLQKLAMRHRRALAPVICKVLSRRPETNVLFRTTFAITTIEAGAQDNVLPAQASATVNLRLAPGDSVAGVVETLTQLMAPFDIQVEPNLEKAHEATPTTSVASPEYQHVAQTISQIWPDAVVVPTIHTGASDSRHYLALSDNIIRFAPLNLTLADLPRFHGIDERIALADLQRCVEFYVQLLASAPVAKA